MSQATRELPLWPLRLAVAAMSLGVGLATLRHEGPVFSLLFEQMEYEESSALALVHSMAWVLLLLVPLVFVRRAWPLLLVVSLWMGLRALAITMNAAEPFSSLAHACHALRYSAPLALLLLSNGRHVGFSYWLLRLATAATFAAHGWEALLLHPEFVDFIIMAFRCAGMAIGQESTESILVCIGVVDLLAALALLRGTWAWLLLYLVFWGLLTAASRILHSGWADHSAMLERLVHGLAPLALYLYARKLSSEAPPGLPRQWPKC